MRLLVIIVAALALVWGGYWFVGARAVETGARAALAGMATADLQISHAGLNTIGFPSRFDTTLTEPLIRDARSGLGWSAPFMQVFALSYQPNKVIVVWPDSQEIFLPDQTLTLATTGLRASAAVAPRPALPLAAVTLESGTGRLTSDQGWTAAFDSLLVALRAAPDSEHSYDLWLDLATLALPEAVLAALDPAGRRPDTIARLHLDATARLTGPLDRHAGEAAPPRLTGLTLHAAEVDWGDAAIAISAEIDADQAGLATGSASVTLSAWREMLQMLVDAAAISPEGAQTWADTLAPLAAADGSLTAPLSIRAGQIWFGLLPLARLPPLQ